MKNNSALYSAETRGENFLILIGRMNALADYVRNQKFAVEREVIAAILGFELEEERHGQEDLQV